MSVIDIRPQPRLVSSESPCGNRIAYGGMQGAMLPLGLASSRSSYRRRQSDSRQDASSAFAFSRTTAARIHDGVVSRIARSGSCDS